MQKTTSSLYKGHYFFAFYSEDGETLIYTFDNFFQICKFLNLETTNQNLAMIQRKIVNSIKYYNNNTRIFNTPMLVYMIDMNEDDSDTEITNEKEENQNGKQNQNHSNTLNFSHIRA